MAILSSRRPTFRSLGGTENLTRRWMRSTPPAAWARGWPPFEPKGKFFPLKWPSTARGPTGWPPFIKSSLSQFIIAHHRPDISKAGRTLDHVSKVNP